MSSTSPAKCSPGHNRLSIVRNSTSRNRTPPHVTNSSLFVLFPLTANSAAPTCAANAAIPALPTFVHGVVAPIPAATTNRSQNRCGIPATGLHVVTCFFRFFSRAAASSFTSVSRECSGAKFTTSVNL